MECEGSHSIPYASKPVRTHTFICSVFPSAQIFRRHTRPGMNKQDFICSGRFVWHSIVIRVLFFVIFQTIVRAQRFPVPPDFVSCDCRLPASNKSVSSCNRHNTIRCATNRSLKFSILISKLFPEIFCANNIYFVICW